MAKRTVQTGFGPMTVDDGQPESPVNLANPEDWFHSASNPYRGDYAGMPFAPSYSGVGDPDKIPVGPGLAAFRKEALRTGPSAWAGLSMRKQGYDEAIARDRAKREAASAGASAGANLAMRGGLSAGGRERINMGTAKNLLGMSQDISRQGADNRLQIGINDETNRIQQMGMLPGMEQAAYGQEMAKKKMENDFKQQNYKFGVEAFTGQKQAQATQKSGK